MFFNVQFRISSAYIHTAPGGETYQLMCSYNDELKACLTSVGVCTKAFTTPNNSCWLRADQAAESLQNISSVSDNAAINASYMAVNHASMVIRSGHRRNQTTQYQIR